MDKMEAAIQQQTKPLGFLVRTKYAADHVSGVLYVGGKIFHTIERAWLDNQQNISCIPLGEYQCAQLPRSGSGKYRDVYHVQNVPGRGGILIHNGNLASDSKGCIILGKKAGVLSGKPAVLNSKSALKLLNKICPDGLKLYILRNRNA